MTSVGVRSSALLEPKRTTPIVQIARGRDRARVRCPPDPRRLWRLPHLLADGDHVLACLGELPERLGMHKLAEPFLVELGHHSPKDPGGVSGFVMIAESHISIHTFPLRGFVSADVYTCQDSLDTEQICRYFADAFGLQDLEINLVRRGTRYPQHNIYDPPQQVA